MSIFALVHGAWCWERVAPLLRDRGHEVVAPELPSEDTELGLEDYAETIGRALGDAGGASPCAARGRAPSERRH